MKLGIIYLLFLYLGACVGTPPYKELNLAQTAMDSARAVEAPELTPGLWLKAEEEYRRAMLLYQDRDYDNARTASKRAQKYAEKAENVTLLKKFKSGGGL